MPYVTSFERLARQEGRQETLQEDVLDILEARFGTLPEEVRQSVRAIGDNVRLKQLHRRAVLVESLSLFTQEL